MSLTYKQKRELEYQKSNRDLQQSIVESLEEKLLNAHRSLELYSRHVRYLTSIRDGDLQGQIEAKLGWSLGNFISFVYNGRHVKGIFESCSSTHLNLKLKTKYQGKNVTWDVGQFKTFSLKIILKENIENVR